MLHALFVLNGGGPAIKAVEELRRTAPYELGWPTSMSNGSFGALYPIYVRGSAYLAANKAKEAEKECSKILANPGVVYNDPLLPVLARLQFARACRLAGNLSQAKSSYQQFRTFWKYGDADIAILKQAELEFGNL